MGKDSFWRSVRDGVSGVGHIRSFDVSDLPSRIGGEVRDFEATDWVDARPARRQGRFVNFALAAAQMCLDDSGLELHAEDPRRIGVAFGTSGAGFGSIADDYYTDWVESGFRRVNRTAVNEIPAHAASSHISIEFGLQGPMASLSVGCVSAFSAVAQAVEFIREGQADCMIVGGTEACLSRLTFHSLCRQGVMSTDNDAPLHACRPFDADGGGLVLGEGAGALVVETAKHAMDRGAHIYGELLGHATAAEAFHMVASAPSSGAVAARALSNAMAMARVSPTDIDYVCAHGIGMPDYDVSDTVGIKQALGDHAYRVPVNSIKPVTAQPFAACGAMQLASTCMTLDTQIVPPTCNHSTPREGCDLDYVPGAARRARVDTLALNAHSFGGTHAALVVGRFDPSR